MQYRADPRRLLGDCSLPDAHDVREISEQALVNIASLRSRHQRSLTEDNGTKYTTWQR